MESKKKTPKSTVKRPTFDVYKSIKDEIIEISELRFENILTKKLDKFRHDFKAELMEELNPRFEAIDTRFDAIDARFGALDSKFDAINSKFGAIDLKFDAINLKIGALDSKFGTIDSKFDIFKWSIWSLPIVISILMALFVMLLKYVI
jgi:hypothetical protein